MQKIGLNSKVNWMLGVKNTIESARLTLAGPDFCPLIASNSRPEF